MKQFIFGMIVGHQVVKIASKVVRKYEPIVVHMLRNKVRDEVNLIVEDVSKTMLTRLSGAETTVENTPSRFMRDEAVTEDRATEAHRADLSFEFDCNNPNWNANPEYNAMFFRSIENYMNDRLRSTGYVFLNDVYQSLGMARTGDGQLLGWLHVPGNPGHIRLNVTPSDIDHSYLIDFDVDGIIYNKI